MITTGTQETARNPRYAKYPNHRLLIQNPKNTPAAVAYRQLIIGSRKKKRNPSAKLQFLTRSAFSRMILSGSTSKLKLKVKALQKHRLMICPGEPDSTSGCRFICRTTVSVTCAPTKEMLSANTTQNSKARMLNSGTLASMSPNTPNVISQSQYEKVLCIVGCIRIF